MNIEPHVDNSFKDGHLAGAGSRCFHPSASGPNIVKHWGGLGFRALGFMAS